MKKYSVKTEKEINIIFNTYRMKIIDKFKKMENKTATFKQIADALGDNSSKVTYHGKMLIEIGILKLSHTKIINGINAKYYQLQYDGFEITKEGPLYDMTKDLLKKQVSNTLIDVYNETYEKLAKATQFNEMQSIHISSDELYLTREEIEDFNDCIHKYTAKSSPRPNTIKVDMMSLLIYKDNDNESNQ